ncbi:hypothetical protein NDI39_01830 [Microcoleus sp. ZQ-A2]|nr:hypothetical protein [Microcoleus sp. FACHB-1]
MNWSKEQNQQKLKELYGVEFPDALFGVHDFMISRTENDDKSMALSVIGLYPAGPLELLLEFSASNASTTSLSSNSPISWVNGCKNSLIRTN